MRSGGFPGQFEAIKARVAQIRAEAEQAKLRASRRLFLGLAVGGVVGACAGGGAVHALQGAGEERFATGAVDASLDWARKLATGPLDALLAAAGACIGEAYDAPAHDDALWLCIARLASAVLDNDARVPKGVRAALLTLRERSNTPPLVRAAIEAVQSSTRSR